MGKWKKNTVLEGRGQTPKYTAKIHNVTTMMRRSMLAVGAVPRVRRVVHDASIMLWRMGIGQVLTLVNFRHETT